MKEKTMSSVEKLSRSSSLDVCRKLESLIHNSWYPNLYTTEGELHNNKVTSKRQKWMKMYPYCGARFSINFCIFFK